MEAKEREDWLKELASRTVIWTRKREQAKKRMQLKGVEALGKIDAEVAEAALERIEAKKRELWDEEKAKLDAYYPVPMGVPRDGGKPEVEEPKPMPEFLERANMHTHNISPEEDDSIQYARNTKPKAKKKVHKNPSAAFAAVVEVKSND